MKYLSFLASILVLASFSVCGAQPGANRLSDSDASFQPDYFDTLSFRLYPNETGFFLRNRATGFDYQIPLAMLTPPESPEYDEFITDLMGFDSCVSAFPIGENRLGIQLSSYNIGGGSMGLSQGLDVFLTLDTAQKKVLPKALHLGITKQRNKYMGFVEAMHTHFLISHYSSEKNYSLGLYQERIYIKIIDDGNGIDGPYYEQTPIHWYVFDGDEWHYEAALDKRLPVGGGELPLLGIIMTPVEYARSIYQRRRN